MGAIYFPSCNFTKASPKAARRLRSYLKEKMPVAGCCRVDNTPYPAGDKALYFCQACRETLEQKPGNQLIPENLFVWLLEQADFPWPDYRGLTVNVQDCWRDRRHPEVFDAARGCLAKMGVKGCWDAWRKNPGKKVCVLRESPFRTPNPGERGPGGQPPRRALV